MEEGYKVYKTQPKTLKREKPPQSSPLEQQLKKRIQELEEIIEIRKGKGAERVVRNQVKLSDERPRSKGMSYNNIEDSPPSPFKHPCHKCEDKPGTDREKKDYCTNKHHCRIHDGQYMCIKSQACRDRTAKERTLREFKRAKIPTKGANMATINRIMRFDDEEIEKMTEEEMDQPCNWGDRCPQENFGNHAPKCKVEMNGYNHRAPGQPWKDVAMKQEEFNSNLEDHGARYPDQFGNRYNYEDNGPVGREESDMEEAEAEGEGEDNK